MMFKEGRTVLRGAVYGTYTLRVVAPGSSFYQFRSLVQAIRLIIEVVKMVFAFNACKAYCLRHGYHVSFRQVAFEAENEASQGESMELRRLIQSIEQDGIDIVLFIDFNWIRNKPGQVERLLKLAKEHKTMLVDVREEQIINLPQSG